MSCLSTLQSAHEEQGGERTALWSALGHVLIESPLDPGDAVSIDRQLVRLSRDLGFVGAYLRGQDDGRLHLSVYVEPGRYVGEFVVSRSARGIGGQVKALIALAALGAEPGDGPV